MIQRTTHLNRIVNLSRQFPVTGLIGARQCGKTTLAMQIPAIINQPFLRFDLENPKDLARLSDPMLALQNLKGIVIIDEIQQMRELFPVLRVLADRPDRPAQFIILGSASPELIHRSSESLAGRIAYYELNGFSIDETGAGYLNNLWLRGGFPRSFLSDSDKSSLEWRRQFIDSFLMRDLPQLGITIPSLTLRRFWTMLAHYHGQIWNSSEFSRSFGVADTTIRRYLDIMAGGFMIQQLQPWHENLKKRQVKSPKIYFSDSGLLHAMLQLETQEDLEGHPKSGASWEGFTLRNVVHSLNLRKGQFYFWATHNGAELDLLVVIGRKRWGFEFKRTVSPQITRSMSIAIQDLTLEKLFVIHAGDDSFPLADKIQAVAIQRILEDLQLS